MLLRQFQTAFVLIKESFLYIYVNKLPVHYGMYLLEENFKRCCVLYRTQHEAKGDLWAKDQQRSNQDNLKKQRAYYVHVHNNIWIGDVNNYLKMIKLRKLDHTYLILCCSGGNGLDIRSVDPPTKKGVRDYLCISSSGSRWAGLAEPTVTSCK